MKAFKVFYTGATGLRQANPIHAYRYLFHDGYIHFYYSEECIQKGEPFKSINQNAVWLVEEDRTSVPLQ